MSKFLDRNKKWLNIENTLALICGLSFWVVAIALPSLSVSAMNSKDLIEKVQKQAAASQQQQVVERTTASSQQ